MLARALACSIRSRPSARPCSRSSSGAGEPTPAPGKKKPGERASIKVLDRPAIEDKALAYLNRFDASAARLRRVLVEFVRRRAKEVGVDVGPHLTVVDETLERYRQSGLIDDKRFGATMARSLAERGASRQAIKAKLHGRGLSAEDAEDVLSGLNRDGGSELDAARALVRKRKLGNYRPASERRENYRRDLGVLARAGFSFDTAKAALGVEGADEGDEGF